mgnify:CR=1 FL=1|jgi:protein AroM
MGKIKIGFITIGQSPRKDIMEEILPVLGDGFDIIEIGALDGYSYNDLINKFSLNKFKNILVTKLLDGNEIMINEEYLNPLVQNAINILERKSVNIIVILCTGEFSNLNSNVILIESSNVTKMEINKLRTNYSVGIIIPDDKQYEQMKKRWDIEAVDTELLFLSPYGSQDEIEYLAEEIKRKNWDYVFLDCMGYSKRTKDLLERLSNKKVYLSRFIVAEYIRDLLEMC